MQLEIGENVIESFNGPLPYHSIMNLPTKGEIGHVATGLIAGALIGSGFHLEGIYVSGLVQIRQSVSWLHKRDSVGKDMMEHLIAAAFGLFGGLGYTWYRTVGLW